MNEQSLSAAPLPACRCTLIIRTTVRGASRTSEVAGLQLTNNGWKVP
jgi:hypothetical protein